MNLKAFTLDELTELQRIVQGRVDSLQMTLNQHEESFQTNYMPAATGQLCKMKKVLEKLELGILIETRIKK